MSTSLERQEAAATRERRLMMVKAELELIRIQSHLDLSDDELLLAVQRVIGWDMVAACCKPVSNKEETL